MDQNGDSCLDIHRAQTEAEVAPTVNAKTEGVCCYLRTTCGPCGRASAPMALLFWCAWAILGWNVLTLEKPGHSTSLPGPKMSQGSGGWLK